MVSEMAEMEIIPPSEIKEEKKKIYGFGELCGYFKVKCEVHKFLICLLIFRVWFIYSLKPLTLPEHIP